MYKGLYSQTLKTDAGENEKQTVARRSHWLNVSAKTVRVYLVFKQ